MYGTGQDLHKEACVSAALDLATECHSLPSARNQHNAIFEKDGLKLARTQCT